ncbi:MAG: hypothetical protein J7L96_03965 [Bacteroidales bacterium]|nr:hypothetical protein [Bacteroidales bacterium]
MRKRNKPLWLLCSFLCVIISANAQDNISNARVLFDHGKYQEANLAYEYAAYKSNDPTEIIQAKIGRARALKKMHAYERGLEVLSSINLLTATNSLRPALVYETVLLSFLNHDYQGALAQGQMGTGILRGTEYEGPVYYMLALAALEESEWETAKAFGDSYISNMGLSNPDSTSYLTRKYDSLMTRQLPKLKDPDKARKWSTIIPGSGQIYAGAIGDGLYNFGLHAVVLGISGWAFLSGYYVTGWFSGSTVLQKFHSGGQIRAVEICEKRNRLKIREYSQPVNEFLINLRN